MIETYTSNEEGYTPFLIREGWQVAQLNYVPLQGLRDIEKIDVHFETDEVFILLEGTAVLLAVEKEGDCLTIESILLEKGITYNIPAGQWHNIAMDTDARLLIVEKSNTHLSDFEYYPLTPEQRQQLYDGIQRSLK